MTDEQFGNLTVEQSQKILQQFSCTDTKLLASEAEKTLLQEALKQIVNLSDYLNLGICADTAEQALLALKSYLQGLEYSIEVDAVNLPEIEGSVYLKFNINKESYYFDSYTGNYRGVLVSCQSSEDDRISGTYGHLPLELFT